MEILTHVGLSRHVSTGLLGVLARRMRLLTLWISVTEHGSAALVGAWRMVRAELAEVHNFRSIG